MAAYQQAEDTVQDRLKRLEIFILHSLSSPFLPSLSALCFETLEPRECLLIGFSGRNDESLEHMFTYICKAQNVEPGDALDCFIRSVVFS